MSLGINLSPRHLEPNREGSVATSSMIETVTDLFHQEAADLADDARRLLLELDRDVPGAAAVNAECRPPLDVLETATAVEVVIDVPGVPPESLRVAVRRSTLLV